MVVEAAKFDPEAKDDKLRSRDDLDLASDPQLRKAIELMGTWKGDVVKIGGVAGFDVPVAAAPAAQTAAAPATGEAATAAPH